MKIASLCVLFLIASPEANAPPLRFTLADIVWKDGLPTMPPGTKMAVLEGNPKEAALFTLRVKLPAGFVLKPHTHPGDERVTVISGTAHVGYGVAFDKAKSQTFPAGSFYVTRAGTPHFLWSDEEVVLQLNNMGPWKVDPVETK
jgi:quercetin dioxygenase-like cupin family protein